MTEVINLRYTAKAYKAYSFKGNLKEYSSNKLHKHTCHEVLLIKNGVSILTDGNIRQPLFGTSLAFIPSNIPHRSLVVGQGLEYMVLFIHKALFQLNSGDMKIFNPGELALALFNKLCSINNSELAKGFSGECLNLFLSAIKEDIKNESKVVRLPESKNTNNLKIMDFIYKNYNRKLNISDFRKIMPYTVRHISRIFSNELKIGIFEYLRLYRVLMASIEISKDDKNITNIAFECGYESLSSFYKDFKTFFGIAPKELRARVKLK